MYAESMELFSLIINLAAEPAIHDHLKVVAHPVLGDGARTRARQRPDWLPCQPATAT
jgi:hypothetical protein